MVTDVLQVLSSKWWTFVLRGIVALALAVFAFAAPTMMAAVLVFIVAVYFIINGLSVLFAGLAFTGAGSWWSLILLGIVQIALGVIMLAKPGAGPLALAYLFAIWFFLTGSMEISTAITFRQYISGDFWWVLLGLITLAFGIYIVLRPEIGVLGLVYTMGLYAVLAGISLIAVGARIKNLPKYVEAQTAGLKQSYTH
jgi:uncharacterized membrane protein HdeD (DUF308 family)